jgi:DNA-directed RNA polymerase III subunit RPC3
MTNPFGFVYTSPLSSLPHDPVVTLASNCIRDYFGPTVQTVADCLQTRGGSSSLAQLITAIRGQCRRVWNEERERLVVGKYQLHRARGPASAGYVVEAEPIRDALSILLQHGLVHVDVMGSTYLYHFDVHRARLLIRYPRFVEYAKKALDETAATLVEELLIHGRMTTVDAVVAAVNHLHEFGDDAVKSDRYTTRQAVVESFRRLVEGGFIETVPPLKDDDEEEEAEFEGKTDKTVKAEDTMEDVDGGDPAIVSLLSLGPYRHVLPRNTVWRVNVRMFHDSLRAFYLGRLVAERFGHKVQSAGSMVTAALKLAAHKQHALKNQNLDERTVFSPDEIVDYLPKPVQQSLEKKPGGILANLSRALVEISKLSYPQVLSEVEQAAGNPTGGKFEVATRQLVNHLRERIHHQVVK